MPPRLFTLDSDHHAYNTCFYAALAAHGVEIREVNFSGRILFRTLRRGDWLHLHWPSFGYYSPRVSTLRNWLGLGRYLALLALLRLRGVRIAWTAHNLYPHEGGPSSLHHAGRAVVTRLCSLILAHGPTAATIITSRLGVPPAKIRQGLIGNWIDHYPNGVSREAARAELGLGADDFTFLFIGLIRPYKDIEGLIECFSRLEGDRLRLVIAGGFLDQEYQQTIERLAAADDRIALRAGYVEDERLAVFLNAADRVVLPYTEILSSGAAILAMSFGRPVVAPDRGSLRDHVPPVAGDLYDPSDPRGLDRALEASLERGYRTERILAHARTLTWESLAGVFAEGLRARGSAARGSGT